MNDRDDLAPVRKRLAAEEVCEPTLEGIAQFLEAHVADEKPTLLLIYLMLTRIAIALGTPVSMEQLKQEVLASLTESDIRLLAEPFLERIQWDDAYRYFFVKEGFCWRSPGSEGADE